MQRVSGLDKVRALAALSVMLAHLVGAYLPGAWRYVFTGTPAVIAFFVVSGFCIHYPYRDAPLPTAHFVIARFIRIGIPMAVAMYLARTLGIKSFNLQDGYILWSLVCELWYYALYPVLLALSRFVGWRAQWTAAMAVSYAIVLTLGSDESGNLHIYGPLLTWLVCLPAWLLGCVLAEQHKARPWPVVPVRVAIAAAASSLVFLSHTTPIGLHLTMNVFAIAIYFWIRNEIAAGDRTWLDRVGAWSYSIYLFHVVAAQAIGLVIAQRMPGLLSPVVVPPLVLAACYLAYRFVERPAHQLARAAFAFRLTNARP
jgi:peptidoglycan/LPS O-acetylase OafA/YrhL